MKRYIILGCTAVLLLLVGVFFVGNREPRAEAIKMSFISVSQSKDGRWWTTLLMTNQSKVDFDFTWLSSEDYVLQDDGKRGPPVAGPIPAPGNQIASEMGQNFGLEIPPPGTVRRFRIHYFPSHQPSSRIYRYLDRYFHFEKRRLQGHIAISPEVSADFAITNCPAGASAKGSMG